jgi:dTDP-4-dehydrorhamnose reductase
MSTESGPRVLLLGASGMLGRAIAPILARDFEVVTPPAHSPVALPFPSFIRVLRTPLNAATPTTLEALLTEARPAAVVNCIARHTAERPEEHKEMEALNTHFPHALARHAPSFGMRVVHIGTDGVFSGRRGFYSETDPPDSVDPYGRTKLAGEIAGDGCLTLRTTFLGPSDSGRGLVEWLLRHRGGSVQGFARYVFSGLSMGLLGDAIRRAIALPRHVHGVWHAGGPATSKFAILQRLSFALDLDLSVEALDEPQCDRSLDSSRFWTLLDQPMPSIDEVVADVKRAVQARQSMLSSPAGL